VTVVTQLAGPVGCIADALDAPIEDAEPLEAPPVVPDPDPCPRPFELPPDSLGPSAGIELEQ
jgi:hypothetical protein